MNEKAKDINVSTYESVRGIISHFLVKECVKLKPDLAISYQYMKQVRFNGEMDILIKNLLTVFWWDGQSSLGCQVW